MALTTVATGSALIPAGFDEAELNSIIQAAVDSEARSLNVHYKNDMLKVPVTVKRTRDHMEMLHLDNNYRLGCLPACIGDFPRLRWLDASYCRVKTIAPEIGRLGKLERLHLSNNIIDFLPTELWQLKYLEELRVNENNLKVLPDGLLFLPKLREVSLENNPFYSPQEIEGAEAVTLIPPQKCVNCANCRILVRNYQVSITFHTLCGHASIPFVHFVCSDRCGELLQRSLEKYDADLAAAAASKGRRAGSASPSGPVQTPVD